MPTYTAQASIYDGKRQYQPGDNITLTDADAAPLLELGYLVVSATTAGVSSVAPASLINLNTASRADLEALPHVGRATAKKLIAMRTFTTLEEAERASELRPEQWAEVAPLVEV